MTSLPTETTPESTPQVEKQPDLTGRSRMAWNVVISWACHFVFIVAGFIMPRMIDRKLGQETLGIWDFSWSMIAYFGLIQLGVGSSVNRYVARYRACGEMELVSRLVSSVTFLLCCMGCVVAGLTLLCCHLLPLMWGERLGGGIDDAQVVLLTLGVGLAVQFSLAAFTSVVTGCHRWDIHNYIKSFWQAVTVVVMIVLLHVGCGIKSLAVANLVSLILADVTHIVYAFHLCRGMRVGLGLVRLAMIRDSLSFGVRATAPQVANLLLNQTSSILVAGFLGPAALALYSRPKSLVRHSGMLVSKLAVVLIPTASALQSTNSREELAELLITATRWAAYISLPVTVGLSIMGGPLLLLWMGPGYADGILVALVVLGEFAVSTFLPTMCVLVGLNAHGRPGLVHVLAALCSIGFVFLALGPLGMGLRGAAIAVALPLTLVYGVYVTCHVCRLVGLSWMRFLRQTFQIPLLCVAPLAVALVMCRLLMPTKPLHALSWGMMSGGVLLAVAYWRYVVPCRVRSRLRRTFGLGGSPS
jgi:O-antigen/teichoic acid export membrane protein